MTEEDVPPEESKDPPVKEGIAKPKHTFADVIAAMPKRNRQRERNRFAKLKDVAGTDGDAQD